MGLKGKTSLPWNPQSNAILEKIHQVLADGSTLFEPEDLDMNKEEEDPFEEYLSMPSYAILCAFLTKHTDTLQDS